MQHTVIYARTRIKTTPTRRPTRTDLALEPGLDPTRIESELRVEQCFIVWPVEPDLGSVNVAQRQ